MNYFIQYLADSFSRPTALIFGGMGMTEVMVIALIAVMLFGKNLPGVARKFGKTYREFRKGLSEFQSSVKMDEYVNDVSNDYYDDSSSNNSTASGADDWSADDYDDFEAPDVPIFEPPPSEPTAPEEAD
tara:strand:+ start:917 stop:1303 length:387 start_codon:yes stop_codon:yes gene_type:complete